MKRPRTHWVARLTMAPASSWRDLGPWWARARRWVVHTILREESESCDACGCRMPGCWWVEFDTSWREVYEHVIGEGLQPCEWHSGGLLCPNCFARGATELGKPAAATLGPHGEKPGHAILPARVVFSGQAPSLEFVEVEDDDGQSVDVGTWATKGERTELSVRIAIS